MMLKLDLLLAWRSFMRQRLFSTINVLGLAIGIACCLLIFLFVMQESSYDRFHQNADDIYRVLSEIKASDGSKRIVAIEPLPLAKALREEYPEVVRAVRFTDSKGAVRYRDRVFTERIVFGDPGIFEMFSFHLLAGNPAEALADPTALVISERTSRKYFGDENAYGKQITITPDNRDPKEFTVTGVVQNIPENSSIKFDILMPFVQAPGYDRQKTNWGASNCVTYVQLADGHPGESLERKFSPFVRKYLGERIAGGRNSGALSTDNDAWRLHLQPLTSVHLEPGIKWGLEPPGDPIYSYILSAIAFLVLLIACINFVTLAIARSTGRAREVGIRKVIGAAKRQLLTQFWGESLFLSLVAMAAGMLLAELFLPTFNSLANANLAFELANIPVLVIGMIVLTLSISLLAGGYPAMLLSRFQPVASLQQRTKLGGKHMLGQALVVVQFLLSVLLIASTLVMSRQLDFLEHKDLGYNAEQVVTIPTRTFGEQQSRAEVYKQEISRNSRVLHVSGVNNSFTRGMMTSNVRAEDTSVKAWFYFVQGDFLETLGIELEQGRDFSNERRTDVMGSVIVNEALVNYFGWDEPLGKLLEMMDGQRPTVIGVAKNFHFRSLHRRIEPAVILLHRGRSSSNILVKISRDHVGETLTFLERTWKKVAPLTPFEFYFLDEDVQKQYLADERWASIVTDASVLAVLIACLGLFALAALSATQRTKEIGIRKVLGATTANVTALLSRDVVRLVLLANIIAWPAAYYVMNRWLQSFAYRIDIDWWVFALAGGLALVIALLTVSTQAVRAALANPVDSLRYE